MKKKYITILITALLAGLLSSPSFSQEKPLKLGLRMGLSSSSISEDIMIPDFGIDEIDLTVDRKRRNKFSGGAFLEYWFNRSLALQLNVLYSQKGVRIDTDFEGSFFDPTIGQNLNMFGTTKQSLELTYLSVPLMAKFAFGGGKPGAARPFIMAGPEIGYLLSAKTSDFEGKIQAYVPAMGGGAAEIIESGMDVEDNIESLDYGVNLGAGIIFPLGQTNIFLDGWYSLGLSTVNKDGENNVKNNVVTLNLGLMF